MFSCSEQGEDLVLQQNITLIYMIADNDLATFAVKDINEMESNFAPNDTEKILIYIDVSPVTGLPRNPVLLELQHDETDKIKSKIIFSYPQQNSTDKEVFKMVLEDAIYYGGMKNRTKGLVLWSHGNAWLPNEYHIPTDEKAIFGHSENEEIRFKYFGKDYSPTESVMEIKELADVLSPYHFDYIIFDACFMGSIEVLYELKNSTDFFIASPSEILSDGFPYDQIIPRMTKKGVDLKGICEDFYNYYNQKSGLFQSGTITLVNANYLDDFALFCKSNLSSNWVVSQSSTLQQYTRNDENLLFDLKQLLDRTNQNYPNWKKLIGYQNHTKNMANLPLKECNGVSTYIFNEKNELNEYYKKLSWYKDSGFNPVFDNN